MDRQHEFMDGWKQGSGLHRYGEPAPFPVPSGKCAICGNPPGHHLHETRLTEAQREAYRKALGD
jgi:hypothetical protein